MHRLSLVLSLTLLVACGGSKGEVEDTAQTDATTQDGSTDSGGEDTAQTDATTQDGSTDSGGEDTAGTDVTEPVQCPPEGAELLGNPPPDVIPEGTCEPQPKAVPLPITTVTVKGTDNASEFIYLTPPNPTRLILIFHGGGGSMDDAHQRTELNLFFKQALLAGYAVAALDSVAHLDPPPNGKFKWNEDKTPCNPDVENVVAMVKQLKDPSELGAVPSEAPIYALGISNGGSMTSRTAQHIDFSAVATYITGAKQFHDPGAKIPPVFIMSGENDTTVGIDSSCELYGYTLEQKIDSVFKLNISQAITPGLFTRIASVDCEMSRAILDSFRANGVVDGDDMVAVDPNKINSWKPHVPKESKAHVSEIRDLLLERVAEHAFTSDFIQETLDFFDAHAKASLPGDLPVCEK